MPEPDLETTPNMPGALEPAIAEAATAAARIDLHVKAILTMNARLQAAKSTLTQERASVTKLRDELSETAKTCKDVPGVPVTLREVDDALEKFKLSVIEDILERLSQELLAARTKLLAKKAEIEPRPN